jgi:hypothetical protein
VRTSLNPRAWIAHIGPNALAGRLGRTAHIAGYALAELSIHLVDEMPRPSSRSRSVVFWA